MIFKSWNSICQETHSIMSKQQFPVIDSQTTTEKMAETKGYKTIEMATYFFFFTYCTCLMWECRVNVPKFEDKTSLKGCNCEMISCLGLILNMSKVAAAEGLTQQLTMTTLWVQYCVTVGVEISLWLLLMVQMSLWEFPLTGEGRDRDSELLSGRFFL